jgi:hypothetical protein
MRVTIDIDESKKDKLFDEIKSLNGVIVDKESNQNSDKKYNKIDLLLNFGYKEKLLTQSKGIKIFRLEEST